MYGERCTLYERGAKVSGEKGQMYCVSGEVYVDSCTKCLGKEGVYRQI